MAKVFIVHFSPLELYPPVQNLIRYWESRQGSDPVTIVTTRMIIGSLSEFKSERSFRIFRLGKSGSRLNAFDRYVNYFRFYVFGLFLLILKRPDRILYFETLSSFPVYLYKKFLNRSVEVFIHYHEYTTLHEYSTGMRLGRFFHKKELKLYPHANWVSHTNAVRADHFRADLLPLVLQNIFVMPNYPPKSWLKVPREKIAAPVRIVYVGALSMVTMYTREFADWVNNQKGNVVWDIVSHNLSDDARDYLNQSRSPWINLKNGVDYHQLPQVLKDYDVGVILYKGHIPNYVNNAPNKLFEYIVSGMDVWFPDVMNGCMPYVNTNVYPKVRAFDFKRLEQVSLEETIDRAGHTREIVRFNYEEALHDLTNKMFAE